MALIRSGSVGTESPYLQYELYTDQTGGSVNDRTIKITLKAKISSGYYGYPANWRANINGTWSQKLGYEGRVDYFRNLDGKICPPHKSDHEEVQFVGYYQAWKR